jgi:hypothetical protein
VISLEMKWAELAASGRGPVPRFQDDFVGRVLEHYREDIARICALSLLPEVTKLWCFVEI